MASRYGQQLFFVFYPRAQPPAKPRPSVPVWPDRPVAHRQLVFFDIRPDLRSGRGVVPAPRDPVLAAALDHHAHDYAARHRRDRHYLTRIRAGIRILLGLQHTPGAAITTTEAGVLVDLHLPAREVIAVLADAGMHDDDTTPLLDRWIHKRLAAAGLPDPINNELRTWFEVMRDGSATPPRRRPRSPNTIRLYTTWLLPVLAAWAGAGHNSLREITRDHISDALPTDAQARSQHGQALRSLFGVLHGRKVIFGNPTTRLHTWFDVRLKTPTIPVERIRSALVSENPARAALSALAAFHGLNSGQLQRIKTTDIIDGRLLLDGRVILLAAPVIARLNTWLEYRHTRWPRTINPYLFVTLNTGHREVPASQPWIVCTIDIPGAAAALRSDRIHHEANATQGDVRRLCDLFGISVVSATRYANNIEHPDLRRRT